MAKHRRPIGRRTFLSALAATATSCAIANRPQPLNDNVRAMRDEKRDFAIVGNAPLRDRAAAKGLLYGAATGSQILSSDSTAFAENFAKECAILVPENELKWSVLRPSPDRFDFTQADALLNFARSHNMLFRGHTLVWGQDFGDFGPKWLRETVNRQNAEQVMTNHIKTVVGHYAGQMHSWDVVNEVFDPRHGRADGLSKTPWLNFLGTNYIDLAFRTAAEVDPKALLVLNFTEYDLGEDERQREARKVSALKLLERLKSQGTPVQALGIQGHLEGITTHFNPRRLKAFLRDVASLGLKIMITELDVIDQKLPLDVNVRDRIVAGVYEDYLSLVLEEPAVIAVITWGLSDRYTWYSRFNARDDKAPVRPLPLDERWKRKLAWNAIARAFDKAPKR
ncbi:MAG TPA: endo-1,4-beta-xylanase [Allocoleopsis sp.]